MPQMAPLSWSLLFCSFLALYLLNTTKMYFTNVYSLKSTANIKTSEFKPLSWKW